MSDQNGVEEVSRRCSSEGISDVHDHPEGSSQNNSSKLHQSNEEKPEKVEIGKGEIDSDSIGVEVLSSPGIQEDVAVRDDRGAEKSRPDSGLNPGNDPSNYEQKYPKDQVYEEIAAPNARVWKTYVDESKNHDARMDRESRESLDVLLVFAGLFSAVVTTFVAQTSQNLQADYAQVSASLLFEMVLIQRAIANGSSIDNVPVSSLNPFTTFSPATTDVWVNGLWFMSLSLSLATALVTVLVKQWLHHYLALPSGTPQERSHVRQYRYGGFQKWHVLVIIGLLPVLMHLALGIFFIGLTVFLVPLRPGFSWVIGVGTVVAYVTYLISIFLPIRYPQCPYRTPLSDLVYFAYHYMTQDPFPKHVRPFSMNAVERPDSDLEWDSTVEKWGANISSLDDLERGAVEEQSDTLSVEALHWLFLSSSNPTVHAIVIESIGGLPVSAMAAVKTVFGEATHIRVAHRTLLDDCISYTWPSLRPLPGMESKVERLLRFELFIPHLETYWPRNYIEPADDKRLALAVQSNNALQRSMYKPSNSPTSTAFFQQTIFPGSSPDLPPVIWLGLMQAAKGDGAFDPIDIDSLDDFPLHLCCYVDPRKRPIVRQHPSSVVTFWSAVADYFPEEFATNMLNMLSMFNKLADETSFPTTFICALASIQYLLHRISLSFDIDTIKALGDLLNRFYFNVAFDELPDKQIAAFSDVMEYAVVHSSVFKPDRKCPQVQIILLKLYMGMVRVSSQQPRHNYWPALRPLVALIFQHDDGPYDPPFDYMCTLLEFGLRYGVRTVHDAFLEMQCLDVFQHHSVHPSLVSVLNGYVAGLAKLHASIDSQRHLDYLHKPENLFLACSSLATSGSYSVYPSDDIREDIRALARLRPSDPSWDQCRRKLRDLQDGEGEFFVKRRKWVWGKFEDREPKDIEEAKSHIHWAVEELDRFFSDWKNTKLRFLMHPRELISIAWHFSSRIYQKFRDSQHQERDAEQG